MTRAVKSRYPAILQMNSGAHSLLLAAALFTVSTLLGCQSGMNSSNGRLRYNQSPVTIPVEILERVESYACDLIDYANMPSFTDKLCLPEKPNFSLNDYSVTIRQLSFYGDTLWEFMYEYSAPIPILGFPQHFDIWVNLEGMVSSVGPGGPWLRPVKEENGQYQWNAADD